jgi:hypothetical protein
MFDRVQLIATEIQTKEFFLLAKSMRMNDQERLTTSIVFSNRPKLDNHKGIKRRARNASFLSAENAEQRELKTRRPFGSTTKKQFLANVEANDIAADVMDFPSDQKPNLNDKHFLQAYKTQGDSHFKLKVVLPYILNQQFPPKNNVRKESSSI